MKTKFVAPVARFRAFTIIELLTVIAVIAILATILIPTVGKVRESANAANSSSNIRQIGVGINLFIADSSNEQAKMIGSQRFPAAWGTFGAPYWCKFTWQEAVAEQLEYTVLEPRGYRWVVPPAKTVFQDPGNDVLYNPKNSIKTSSYAINYHIVKGYSKNKPHPRKVLTPADLPPMQHEIFKPAMCVVIAESNRDGAAESWLWPSTGWRTAGAPSHYNGGGHYLFADGHVEWFAAEDMTNNLKHFRLNAGIWGE
ncbi:MAG: type II secretion system protein [Lentimonas sp.]